MTRTLNATRKKRKTALLILGFSRPEFIKSRLEESEFLGDFGVNLICSIDGFRDNQQRKELKYEYFGLREQYPNVEWVLENTNLGLAKHITTRVTESLQVYENLIVIEDDVSVSKNGLLSLHDILQEEFPSSVFTAGMFGMLPKNQIEHLIKNRWRTTKYFSAWGWAIQREKWQHYELDIVKKYGIEKLSKGMIWNQLRECQKQRWIKRFSKVIIKPDLTWDFQMQYLSFLNEFQNVLPLYRICDNEGFDDQRATNTKTPIPGWYYGKRSNSNISPNAKVRNRYLGNLVEYLDSISWIGDQKLFE